MMIAALLTRWRHPHLRSCRAEPQASKEIVVACTRGVNRNPITYCCMCFATDTHPLGAHVASRAQFCPAPERAPDSPVEAEAVDRRGTCDRTDAIESNSAPLETAFLQHTPRGWIADAR